MARPSSGWQYVIAILILIIAWVCAWKVYHSFFTTSVASSVFYADFPSVGDRLTKGAPVKIHGVDVGNVTDMHLQEEDGSYVARVTFCLPKHVVLRTDARVYIEQPFVGSATVWVEPGSDKETIPPGTVISNADAPKDLVGILEAGIARTLAKGDDQVPETQSELEPLRGECGGGGKHGEVQNGAQPLTVGTLSEESPSSTPATSAGAQEGAKMDQSMDQSPAECLGSGSSGVVSLEGDGTNSESKSQMSKSDTEKEKSSRGMEADEKIAA